MGNKTKSNNRVEADELRGQLDLFKNQYQSLTNALLKSKLEQESILRYITGRLLEINTEDKTIQGQVNQLLKELNTVGKSKDAKAATN